MRIEEIEGKLSPSVEEGLFEAVRDLGRVRVVVIPRQS